MPGKALNILLARGRVGIFQIDEEEIPGPPAGPEQQLQYSMISLDPQNTDDFRKDRTRYGIHFENSRLLRM